MHSPPRSAGVRRALTLGIAITLVLALPAPGASAAVDTIAEAQAAITAAQEAAARASAAYDDGQTRYYQLQDDAVATRKAVATARAAQDGLVEAVQQRAVSLYMRAGSTTFDVFRSTNDLLDASRRVKLAEVANAGDDLAVGQLRALKQDLNAQEAALRSQIADAETALDDLEEQEADLNQAVADATEAEQELRAELERQRRAEEYEALAQQARDAARSSSNNGSSNNGSSDDGGDGDDGGAGQIIGSGDWSCPVQGGVSFSDTWGEPRSGHTHHGADMFAGIGTPVVAVVSGSVFFQSDGSGGLAAYVQGNDGNTYYYAHLNDYVGGDRSVSGGELIGHVGNTGNASGGAAHLHFEIRPGGPNGSAVNPTPTLFAHC